MELLLQSLILLLIGSTATRLGLISMGIMLADVVIEIFQTGTVELSYLFKAFLQLEQLQLR